MLVLFLMAVLIASGCVLWFMREAMGNERMAIRQRLADAYRGHLDLVAKRIDEDFARRLTSLDQIPAGPEGFAGSVREGTVESVICFDPAGRITYPREAIMAAAGEKNAEPSGEAAAAGAILANARSLVSEGKKDAAIDLIEAQFEDSRFGRAVDLNGRLVAGNAELMAVDQLPDLKDPRAARIALRLRRRVMDYSDRNPMPPGQRRFLMRELEKRSGSDADADRLLAAEDLAARVQEAEQNLTATGAFQPSLAPGVWKAASPAGHALALFTTAGLRDRLRASIAGLSLPPKVRVELTPPGEDLDASALVTLRAGERFPGWRLALLLEDREMFETVANQKVAAYLWTAAMVIVSLVLLAVGVATAFRRQVRLAQLKNDLVATVSHELKTPLTSMRALVDTLLDSEHPDETMTREYLHLVARENARLSRLIENFLTFSRLERNKHNLEFAPVTAQSIVDGAVAAFTERTRPSDGQLEISTANALPGLRADSGALVTALLNLLDNAWKYSAKEKQIRLRTEAADGLVRFIVTDQGIGLSPAQIRKVFDRFYQADRSLSRVAGGCGLGLSIAHDIVCAHGGSIDVKSQPGLGSAFTIEIPAAANTETCARS